MDLLVVTEDLLHVVNIMTATRSTPRSQNVTIQYENLLWIFLGSPSSEGRMCPVEVLEIKQRMNLRSESVDLVLLALCLSYQC
jgi:hypothetical protein